MMISCPKFDNQKGFFLQTCLVSFDFLKNTTHDDDRQKILIIAQKSFRPMLCVMV